MQLRMKIKNTEFTNPKISTISDNDLHQMEQKNNWNQLGYKNFQFVFPISNPPLIINF